jgi:hypothetical protein
MTHPTEMNKFQRDAAKRGVKPTERTKSWGAEQTAKATAPCTATSRFGKPNLPAERKLAPATPATPSIVINGRKYTDPKLLEAKAAMEQDKTDAAHEAKVRSRTFAMQQDPASIRALFAGWMEARKGQFYPTPFNMENMIRALGSVIAQSGDAASVALLDEVFTFLNANNYLEKAIRRRGEPAALLYPEYVPPVAAIVAPVGAPHRVNTPAEITLPEGQDAKTMPFDELKKLVRAGYKPEARQ